MKVIYVDDEHSAHVNFYYSLRDRTEVESSEFFFTAEDALAYATDNKVDCAFLDINLGHDGTGIQLAQTLRELQPHLEIVFVTSYDEYARDAYRVGARFYLTKPYVQEELDDALVYLKKLTKLHRGEEALAQRPQSRIKVKTFGNFDFLVDGRPVAFKNAKAKELLAFLIQQRGGTVSGAQIFLALWETQEYTSVTSTYVRRTLRALRDELDALEVGDILVCKRNCYCVDPDRFLCDFYDVMSGNRDSIHLYNGEYMSQYSWGETTIPLIERKISALEGRNS